MKSIGILMTALVFSLQLFSRKYPYDGLHNNMGNLYRLSNAKTRSISPENFTGERGKGGMADIKDKDQRNVANAS